MADTFLKYTYIWLALLLTLPLQASEQGTTGKSPVTTPLAPKDSVSINLQEDSDFHFEGEVSEAGTVRLPYIGDFKIAGLTPEQAAAALEESLKKDLYQQAHVSIQVAARAAGTVYIYGAVKQPGAVELPPIGTLTILQALSKSGGITSWAAPSECYVTRTDPVTKERTRRPVDLEQAFQDIGGINDIVMTSGDVIFVPASNAEFSQMMSTEPCEVIVVGEVQSPGMVSFAPGETHTLMRAIFKAGNFTRLAMSDEVRLVRYQDGKRVVDLVNVAEIMAKGYLENDIQLRPGDMIIVERLNPGTVYVYGAVKNPGPVQLPIKSSMTVLQALSKVGGVTSWADPSSSYLTRVTSENSEDRQNISVDLLTAFRDIGGKSDIKMKDDDVLFIPAANAQAGQVMSSDPAEVIVVGEVSNPGIVRFAPGETRTLMRAIIKAGNFSRFAKSRTVRLVRYEKGNRSVEVVNIEQIMEEGLLEKDVELQPGDMIIVDQKMFSFN